MAKQVAKMAKKRQKYQIQHKVAVVEDDDELEPEEVRRQQEKPKIIFVPSKIYSF